MSIRDYIIRNIKNDTKKDIIDMINSAVEEYDEATLPGMGVLLELLWKNLNDNEKNNIAKIIVDNIKDEVKNTAN